MLLAAFCQPGAMAIAPGSELALGRSPQQNEQQEITASEILQNFVI
jgi:hypothetical protein